ncbi:uncharacterized protein [Physcomitrium patens]|uniref:DUF8204 domain-containing protein n=1 Tax=Physcomitrium patens TaxID=3218 RepID=A0A7I4DQQ8_PHYPA|nr:uncharacterized protein LOC112279297 isoform X1 [Physcomitrium patens]|eukprot:XP_024369354.1 uncharacterized protein LOC112279297 isoform X1 [Physcomitrella patens]
MASEAADPSSSGAGAPEEIKISRSIRSCRGCLLYSSIMRERGRNPVCLGLSRSTDAQAYIPDGKMDNEVARNFRNFTDFKYACIGYSTHKEVNSNQLTQPTDSTNELPYCFGLEFLADRKPTTQAVPSTETAPYTNSPPPPKPLQERPHREDGPNALPRPPSSIGGLGGGGLSADEFATRFFRSSRLVATAVVNNVGRVASNIRSTIDKIFTSDQGRPKA